MKIVKRNTLAPLLFPFLKKMVVRKSDLKISSCGNKILGIICQDNFKGYWYFLIYDVMSNKCQRKYLGGGGTRGSKSTERVGEKGIKEWIIADGWKNYIFYKITKRKTPPKNLRLEI